MLNRGVWITGTDTGVGKTVVSALLMSCLKNAKYFKPVQTGSVIDDDTTTVMQLAGLTEQQVYPPVYKFKAPLSPDRAAALENASVSVEKLVDSVCEIQNQFTVIEGAGGLEVPLNETEKFSGLMARTGLPVLLVASTRLGTINHTLLSVQRIKTLGLPFLGLVLNGAEDKGLREVFEREGVPVLFELPQASLTEDWESLKKKFSPAILKLQETQPAIDLQSIDQEIVWHPYTQHGTAKDFPVVRSAQGSEIYFENGQSVIDAISSWWVNLHGHSHPYIAQAISAQAHKLEHVIFAGYTHQPAVTLAQRLLKQTQKLAPKIEKVFYSDNGSTAVEVALKMAYQAQKQKGEKGREKFLALKGSYHGDTLAAMSASDRNGFHKIFTPLMAPVDFIEPDDFSGLEKIADQFHTYAACIVEPLVQGAGGMRFYSPEYLQKLTSLCREKGVYLIADEVFTGFYRLGTFLACELAQVQPDLICLSKGITGGFLPLSVTLSTSEIFSAFKGESLENAFLHGHSYTANPIACAAANASLDLLLSPEGQQRIVDVSRWTQEHVSALSELKNKITNSRALGTLGAFEVSGFKGYFSGNFSRDFAHRCQEKGVLIRPLGGTVYTLLPYCTSSEQLDKVYTVIQETLREMEIL